MTFICSTNDFYIQQMTLTFNKRFMYSAIWNLCSVTWDLHSTVWALLLKKWNLLNSLSFDNKLQNVTLVLEPGSGFALDNFTHCKCKSTTLPVTIRLKWVNGKISRLKIASAFYCLILLSNFTILFLVDSTYLKNNKTF